MSLLQRVLRPAEAEVVEKLSKLFADGVAEMNDVWGEKPKLQRGRILFEQRRNKIIPVVELYFVLGGQYRHGIYYKASAMEELPGRYSYEHKTVPYCLTPSVWRKTAEKRLIEVLRILIIEHSDEIPPRVSKLLVKEGPRSLHVLCRFLGHKTPSLALELTPTLEGAALPEGLGELAFNVCAAHLSNKSSCEMWLLVPPVDMVSCTHAWELAFPSIIENVFEQEDRAHILQAALFLSWLGVKRGWDKMGIHNSFSALQTVALNVATNKGSCIIKSFKGHVKMMIDLLQESIQNSSLPDFFVPGMNYLAGISEDQRASITQELKDISEIIKVDETLQKICRDYPLLRPESLLGNSEYHSGESCDDEDSEKSSISDLLSQGLELDEGGGGEGSFEVDSAPPLDVKEGQVGESISISQDLKDDSTSKLGRVPSHTGWVAYFEEQLMGGLLSIVLLGAIIIFILPSLVGQFDGLGSYFNGDDSNDTVDGEAQDSDEAEMEQPADATDPPIESDEL